MPKKDLIFLLASLFLVVTILISASIDKPSQNDIAYTVDDQPVFSTKFWGGKIEELGMHEAYTLLAATVADMDDYGQHLNAHQFGDALFKRKYVDGVVVCDNRFGHGCFHQFFMTAMSGEGADIATTFEKVCANKLGIGPRGDACNHGIGHGIMTAFYWENIEGALNICDSFQNKNAFLACIDGVFMEYFTPTHLVVKGKVEKRRDVNPENPDSVCLSINPKFQPTCYSMAVSWWLTAGISAKDSGKWCRNIKEKNNYNACFKGLGYTLVLASKYKKDLVIKKCEEAVNNMHERVLCRAGAHWGFSRGEEVGEVLTKEDKALCDFQEKQLCLRETSLTDDGSGISTICCPNLESL